MHTDLCQWRRTAIACLSVLSIACGGRSDDFGRLPDVPMSSAGQLFSPAPVRHPLLPPRADGDSAAELQVDNYGLDAVLVDSLVVVGDRTSIKWYSRAGRLVRAVGRKGGGPGEFNQIVGLCRFAGDSLLVFDQDYRVSTLSAEGVVVRTIRPAGAPQPEGCFRSGVFLVRTGTSGRSDGLADYQSLTPAGEPVARYPDLPATTSAFPPRTPLFAFAADTLYVADGWHAAVLVYDELGRPVRVMTWKDVRRQVAADSPLVVRSEAPASGGRRSTAGAGREEVPMFRRIQVDASGQLGLLTLWRRSREAEWTFVGKDGPTRRLRFADGAGRWTLFFAAADSALVGFESQEDGVRVAYVPLVADP